MTYYYIRTLIFRPAVGSALGAKAAPALMTIADASKHIVQITELLEERNLSFSFCLNKCDILAMCGMTLLFRLVDLKPESKLMRDDQRLVNTVIKILDKHKAPGSLELRKVAHILISVDGSPRPSSVIASASPASASQARSSASPLASSKSPASSGHSRKKSNSGSSKPSSRTHHHRQDKSRRMTVPNLEASDIQPEQQQQQRPRVRQSFDGINPDVITNNTRDPLRVGISEASAAMRPNLDYMSLGNTPSQSRPATPGKTHQQSMANLLSQQSQTMNTAQLAKMPGVSSTEWEALLGSMDGGLNNVYDAIYGGSTLVSEPTMSVAAAGSEWSPDSWDLSGFSIGDFGSNPEAPQSVLSISEESLSSGEEVAPSELGLSVSSVDLYKQLHNGDAFGIDALEGFIM